jgi:large subunit ribosomal protein L33
VRKPHSFLKVKKISNKKGNKTMGIKGKLDKMVVLACEECKERNYTTTKNKKTLKERMELNKYCPKCKKHTAHKETK